MEETFSNRFSTPAQSAVRQLRLVHLSTARPVFSLGSCLWIVAYQPHDVGCCRDVCCLNLVADKTLHHANVSLSSTQEYLYLVLGEK
jgi:hypothetical protein